MEVIKEYSRQAKGMKGKTLVGCFCESGFDVSNPLYCVYTERQMYYRKINVMKIPGNYKMSTLLYLTNYPDIPLRHFWNTFSLHTNVCWSNVLFLLLTSAKTPSHSQLFKDMLWDHVSLTAVVNISVVSAGKISFILSYFM